MTVIYDESGIAVGDVMTDPRREAAVHQLERFTRIHGEDARRIADLIIAAIDATEPTADEIIAAAEAMEEICPSLRDAYPDGPDYTAPIVLAKAALITARKARP